MSSPADMVPPTAADALKAVMKSLDARLIRRGDDETGSPYLWRGYLGDRSDNLDVGIFLHRFVSSDDMELHCHPWIWSWAFILAGGYAEYRALGEINFEAKTAVLDKSTEKLEVFKKGQMNLITANTFHRVELLTLEVWTLFVHGPRVQDWGFVPINRFGEAVPMRLVEGHTRDRLSKEEVR